MLSIIIQLTDAFSILNMVTVLASYLMIFIKFSYFIINLHYYARPLGGGIKR